MLGDGSHDVFIYDQFSVNILLQYVIRSEFIIRRFHILNQNSKDDESIQFYIFWSGFDICLLAINERTA